MQTFEEYEKRLRYAIEHTYAPDRVDVLIDECLERMRVNIGIIAENTELKRKLRLCEEGRDAATD